MVTIRQEALDETTRRKYVTFFFVSSTGTILLFLILLIEYYTETVGPGRFTTNHTTEAWKALLILPLSFLVNIFGLSCFKDRLKRRKAKWYWYLFMKTTLLILLLSFGILSIIEAAHSPSLERGLRESMELYSHYKDKDNVTTIAWNELQSDHSCCGLRSYSDWQQVPYGAFLLATPVSCCVKSLRHKLDCGINMLPTHDRASKFINTKGCFNALLGPTRTSLYFLGTLMIWQSIVYITSFFLSIYIINVHSNTSGAIRTSSGLKQVDDLLRTYDPNMEIKNKMYLKHLRTKTDY